MFWFCRQCVYFYRWVVRRIYHVVACWLFGAPGLIPLPAHANMVHTYVYIVAGTRLSRFTAIFRQSWGCRPRPHTSQPTRLIAPHTAYNQKDNTETLPRRDARNGSSVYVHQ